MGVRRSIRFLDTPPPPPHINFVHDHFFNNFQQNWLGGRALQPHGQLHPCLTYKIHVQIVMRGRGGFKNRILELSRALRIEQARGPNSAARTG